MSVAFASLEITGYIWMFFAISYQEDVFLKHVSVSETCNIKKSFLFSVLSLIVNISLFCWKLRMKM